MALYSSESSAAHCSSCCWLAFERSKVHSYLSLLLFVTVDISQSLYVRMGFSACQFYSVLRHCDKILVLREYCVKLFNVSGYLRGELHAEDGQVLEFDKLPAFLRVLLSADGTVTKILESFFWEPRDGLM